MRFIFIDDDKDSAAQWLRWAKGKGYEAYHVESAYEANKVSADFYVFDISAVTPINLLHSAYSPIATLADNHPGAIIVIVTGMPRNCVEDVIEDVYEACGVRPVYGGRGTFSDFESAIKDYL